MGVQVPCRVYAEVPQEAAVECGTQAAQFSWPQILGEGYFVSTVGRDEETIRTSIKNQEIAGKRLDQLQLKLASS
jgi:hypothetical protein